MSEPVLKCHSISKRFLVGEGVNALKDIRLEVEAGQFMLIAGPSGCGKTTLLNILGGLDRPTHGEVVLNGKRYSQLSENELARLRRHQLGIVFQFFNLLPDLTAAENVALPLRMAGLSPGEVNDRTMELLWEVDMADRATHSPYELSGGQQQRVAIARALANRPAVVLADEPTGNLDSESKEQVMELFSRFNREYGQTFVVVTHDKGFVPYADVTIHMLDGTIVGAKGEARWMQDSGGGTAHDRFL